MDKSVKDVETHAEWRQRYAVAGELLDMEVESHGTCKVTDKQLVASVAQYSPPS